MPNADMSSMPLSTADGAAAAASDDWVWPFAIAVLPICLSGSGAGCCAELDVECARLSAQSSQSDCSSSRMSIDSCCEELACTNYHFDY